MKLENDTDSSLRWQPLTLHIPLHLMVSSPTQLSSRSFERARQTRTWPRPGSLHLSLINKGNSWSRCVHVCVVLAWLHNFVLNINCSLVCVLLLCILGECHVCDPNFLSYSSFGLPNTIYTCASLPPSPFHTPPHTHTLHQMEEAEEEEEEPEHDSDLLARLQAAMAKPETPPSPSPPATPTPPPSPPPQRKVVPRKPIEKLVAPKAPPKPPTP